MPLDVELAEIRDFLTSVPPFSDLPASELTTLPARLVVEYRRRGAVVLGAGETPTGLYVVRSGAVEARDGDGVLVDRGGAGTLVGESVLTGAPQLAVTAYEDTLLLVVPAEVIVELAASHPGLAAYLAGHGLRRRPERDEPPAARVTAGEIAVRPPVVVEVGSTVADAARLMTDEGIASLLVVEGDHLVGILTDRDLRSRVLAAGRDPATSVGEVMTADPVTTGPDAMAVELQLELVRHHIHHLPVLVDGRPVGMVSATDLLRLERDNPVHLGSEAARAETIDEVVQVAQRLGRLVEGLARRGSTALDAGRVVTAVGDAIERRLLTLAEAELGPAPVPWAWVTLGSRARFEQALGGDQDHALVLHDDHDADDPAQSAYFEALAERVSLGLEQAGFPLCRGEKMATNPRWRKPLASWLAQVSRWVTVPDPDAVFDSSVFFDLRHLAGDATLSAALTRHQREAASGSPWFLTHLATHAARRPVPVGFLRGLVVERSGEHRDTLDLKAGGLMVLVEIARVQALAAGSPATGTLARLDDAAAAGTLSGPLATDLRDAWEFIAELRLRHQAAQVSAGDRPDNRVVPGTLGSFERRQLRGAFGVIRAGQAALSVRYPGSATS